MSSSDRKNDAESGTVLLTTLMIMTLMAALSIAVMDDIRIAAKRMMNVDAAAQADWTARSAEDFATVFLTRNFSQLPPATQTRTLMSGEPIIFPTDRGLITLSLSDASQCFNLNSVRQVDGRADDTARREFVSLAELVGVTTTEATRLGAELADWVDADQATTPSGAEDGDYLRRDPPYRTANTALASVGELRALQSMTDETFELLRPFVCIGQLNQPGVNAPLNVNAVDERSLALLTVKLGGADKAEFAKALVANRPAAGYADLAALPLDPPPAVGVLGFAPTAVIIDATITTGPITRTRILRYDGLDKGQPVLTYRGWERGDFRPQPIRDTTR